MKRRQLHSILGVDRAYGSRLRFEPAHLRFVSPSEELVMLGVALGLSNSEIARFLGIQVDTVKSHLVNLFGKFDLRGRAELVLAGYEMGLFVPGYFRQMRVIGKPKLAESGIPTNRARRIVVR